MKFGIGTDIEKASRFRTKNKTFLKKFLSERELRSIRNRNAGHIAGIFCAKE
ncbi:4'-phosphopantetheinyl transferase superfamily protein, partial [Candidatus Woesearchaeota archaeon]|nr:4'-phosphopantetheinyl transferase superfamily protein [Candidatus Woesearchaeota archaeon]